MTAGRSGAARRIDVLGIAVSDVDLTAAVDEVAGFIERRDRVVVCVSDVNALLNAADDPELTVLYNTSGLTVPDGVPLVWAGKLAGSKRIGRVAGPDLMAALIAEGAERGWSSYFYGGAETVPEQLRDHFTAKDARTRIAGAESPPFRELSAAEDDEVVRRINDSGADIVWVGLGAPKQERWMAAHRSRLDAPVLIGVGAAFDYHTGRLNRAPRWMQRAGLEWSYRLYQEPKRLWRRYAIGIPKFGVGLVRRRPKVVPPTGD